MQEVFEFLVIKMLGTREKVVGSFGSESCKAVAQPRHQAQQVARGNDGRVG